MNTQFPLRAAALMALASLFVAVPLLLAEEGTGSTREFRPLDELVLAPDFWALPKAKFAEDMRSFAFQWLSEQELEARAAQPNMKFDGLGVPEASIRFSAEGSPIEVAVSLYNRGDAEEPLAKEEFGKLVKTAQDKLTAKLGVPPELIKGDNTAAVPLSGVKWSTASGTATLQWSFTREMKSRDIPFRAEFLRLILLPPAQKTSLIQEGLARHSDEKKAVIARKAIKDANGDVWLAEVPMVDQGEKGYCVVASAERVLRYYGKEVDQHELAQMANSSAAQGTSSEAMVKALKGLTQKFMIKVRTLEDMDVRGITSMVADYNRVAKRNKKPEIQLGQMIMVDQLYMEMDAEMLKEAKTKSRSDYSRWQSDIKKHVDEGVPVLWTVMVGMFPEEKLGQGHGGHMRLLIGYNEKAQTVIYTDSWGLGHERKTLPMDQAYAMTTGLYSIEPL